MRSQRSMGLMGDDLASLTRPSTWPISRAASSPRLGSKELGARILAFAIPVLIAVEVPGPGTIYLAELCLIGLLPVLVVMRGRMLQSKVLAFILALGIVYFGAQVITDVIRETPSADFARGWSRILFLLFSFISTYLLIGNDRAHLVCYALGLVVGSTLFVVINSPLTAIGWKFGFAGPTTTLVLIGFALVPVLRSPSSLLGPAVMVVLGVFSAFMDFRSWAGVLMLSAAFLSIPAILRLVGLRPRPLSYSRMMIMGMILVATGYGALKVYGVAAESGMLGERSKQKYETQSALGDIGILLGGRSESLVTVQAIQDSPIIGHGSWAKDRYYAELRQLMLYRLGFVNRFIEPETDLIPTHSHLLGSWVEAGLGGALFWVGILMLIIAALRRLYASDDPLRPYLVFFDVPVHLGHSLLPFGAQRRLTNGFLMVTVLFALKASMMNWRQRLSQPAPFQPVSPFAAIQTAAPPLRPGFDEPRPEPWMMPTRHQPTSTIDDDADGNDVGRDAEYGLAEELEDDNGLPPLDEAAERENADRDHEALFSRDDDPAAGMTDIGAGGETIRAGFRRLRQRDR